MRASELTIMHSESSLIRLAIQNTQIDRKLDRKPALWHCVVSNISGHERCFIPPLGEFQHIKMWNGPMVGNHWHRQTPLSCILIMSEMNNCEVSKIFWP